MEKELSVSQEVEFSNIVISDYDLPKDNNGEIFCNLDARKWVNRGGGYPAMLCLFTTSKDNQKLKFFVFRNKNGKYTPTNKKYKEFCCNNDLIINTNIRINYERSLKSGFIYIRELDII